MPNLAIDIGNTRTKAALFAGGQLLTRETWDKADPAAIAKLAYNQNIQNAILSHTANVPADVEQYLRENFRYIRFDRGTPLPIGIRYSTPETLGLDRIAAAAGANCLFPADHVLVVDAGTCITLDVTTAGGEFIGGNISPGVEMRLKAMHHFTAKLPLLERRRPGARDGKAGSQRMFGRESGIIEFLGDSTKSAMLNGAEMGALLEVTGFMEKCRRRFRPLKVVVTGGDADFFVKNIKTKIFANPNLVLIGLNKILEFNVEKLEQSNPRLT